jgi:glycosyltransferase involved in cell wall biosynthesis
LVPHLAQEVDLTLFVEQPDGVSAGLRSRFQVLPHSRFPQERWKVDVSLYHMGNSGHHRAIYEMLRRYPGVVVLHDLTLHHFIAASTLAQNDFAGYARELGYARGVRGVVHGRAARRGCAPLPLEWPLNRRVVDLSLGVVVHSAYARAQLVDAVPQAPVRKIDHLLPLPAIRDREVARSRLGLPDDAFVIVTGGHVIPDKRLELTLAAFERFRHRHPGALWLVVGGWVPGYDALHRAVETSSARDAVRIVGYVEGGDTFYDHLAAADACVNLRCPTAGETSGTVLRAMAIGRPAVVSDAGWYAELPRDVCAHIDHNGDEVAQIEQTLELWHGRPDLAREVGRRARDYVARTCDPARVASRYAAFMRDLGGC